MAKNKAIAKTYQLNDKVQDYVTLLRTLKTDFKAEIGKRTITLKFEKGLNNPLTEKYLISQMSKKVFVAYKKIEKDLKRDTLQDILEDIKIYTEESNNKYFSVCSGVQDRKEESVVLIDINSAYLYALKNLWLIQDETFNYINTLTKQQRLACVGMLARKKEIYHYERGEICFTDSFTCEYRYIYNVIVQEIYKIMEGLENLFSDEFIFSWVDGIYFRSGIDMTKVENYFLEKGYKYKVKFLTEFKSTVGFTSYNFTFREEEKIKVFNMPNEKYIRNMYQTNKAGFM